MDNDCCAVLRVLQRLRTCMDRPAAPVPYDVGDFMYGKRRDSLPKYDKPFLCASTEVEAAPRDDHQGTWLHHSVCRYLNR